MQEFQLQSNIPILLLTIALIVVTILGFLEFKKLSKRVDSITGYIDSLKENPVDNNLDIKKDDNYIINEQEVDMDSDIYMNKENLYEEHNRWDFIDSSFK